jgi:hypothetical protein
MNNSAHERLQNGEAGVIERTSGSMILTATHGDMERAGRVMLTYLKNTHLEMSWSSERLGGFFMMSASGGLKPSAVAGGPSVTRFTHSSCTGTMTARGQTERQRGREGEGRELRMNTYARKTHHIMRNKNSKTRNNTDSSSDRKDTNHRN